MTKFTGIYRKRVHPGFRQKYARMQLSRTCLNFECCIAFNLLRGSSRWQFHNGYGLWPGVLIANEKTSGHPIRFSLWLTAFQFPPMRVTVQGTMQRKNHSILPLKSSSVINVASMSQDFGHNEKGQGVCTKFMGHETKRTLGVLCPFWQHVQISYNFNTYNCIPRNEVGHTKKFDPIYISTILLSTTTVVQDMFCCSHDFYEYITFHERPCFVVAKYIYKLQLNTILHKNQWTTVVMPSDDEFINLLNSYLASHKPVQWMPVSLFCQKLYIKMFEFILSFLLK